MLVFTKGKKEKSVSFLLYVGRFFSSSFFLWTFPLCTFVYSFDSSSGYSLDTALCVRLDKKMEIGIFGEGIKNSCHGKILLWEVREYPPFPVTFFHKLFGKPLSAKEGAERGGSYPPFSQEKICWKLDENIGFRQKKPFSSIKFPPFPAGNIP